MLRRLHERQEWKFFAALPRADRPLACAWWLSSLDEVTRPALILVAVCFLAVATAACALPARRASDIDPMEALRSD